MASGPVKVENFKSVRNFMIIRGCQASVCFVTRVRDKETKKKIEKKNPERYEGQEKNIEKCMKIFSKTLHSYSKKFIDSRIFNWQYVSCIPFKTHSQNH
jgi:hypothetical protein